MFMTDHVIILIETVFQLHSIVTTNESKSEFTKVSAAN